MLWAEALIEIQPKSAEIAEREERKFKSMNFTLEKRKSKRKEASEHKFRIKWQKNCPFTNSFTPICFKLRRQLGPLLKKYLQTSVILWKIDHRKSRWRKTKSELINTCLVWTKKCSQHVSKFKSIQLTTSPKSTRVADKTFLW